MSPLWVRAPSEGGCHAVAVLKLSALRANGDFYACWSWREQQEYARSHQGCYREGLALAV